MICRFMWGLCACRHGHDDAVRPAAVAGIPRRSALPLHAHGQQRSHHPLRRRLQRETIKYESRSLRDLCNQ